MLCLDCQHFDLIVWIGSFTNLHMSSSWYLQTIGKELNRSFRQMFMGQECVTSPKERLRGRLKEHAVSKIIRKQEEKINIIVHFELTYFGNIMQRLVKLL